MSDLYSKDTIIHNLKEGICTILFEKVNGEMREMNCTLIEKLIEENITTKDSFGNVGTHNEGILDNVKKDKRAVNPNLVIAFDLDKKGWRSFRVNSVKSMNVSVEE